MAPRRGPKPLYSPRILVAFLWRDLDQDQWSKICLDHGASKEPMNPLWSWIHPYLWYTMIQTDLGSLILIQITPKEHTLNLKWVHTNESGIVNRQKSISIVKWNLSWCYRSINELDIHRLAKFQSYQFHLIDPFTWFVSLHDCIHRHVWLWVF